MPERAAAPPFDAILLVDADADAVVGGMRLVERAMFALARAGTRRVFCLGDASSRARRLPDVPLAFGGPGDGTLAAWAADAAHTIVVMPATTVADPETLATFAMAPAPCCLATSAALWRSDRATLVDLVSGSGSASDLAPPAGIPRWEPPPTALLCAAVDAAGRAEAEHALFARLGRPGDGWFTRHVDRRFSRAITRRLIPTGVRPNVVTIVSIAIGIAGGCCFADGTPTAAVVGALLFLLSTIVDGCDGELARLTFRESTFGARLDILGDNLVHLFLFGGIAVGLYRRSADPAIALLGGALVLGVCFAMAAVYGTIVRRPPTPRQRALFDAFASREFAYLLVVLTLVGRLDWFLWLSAGGTYVFATGLVVLGRRR